MVLHPRSQHIRENAAENMQNIVKPNMVFHLVLGGNVKHL